MPTSTVWAYFCFPPLCPCLGGFLFGSFCLLGVFGIRHLNDQFCHMFSMWSPWQGRRLFQVHGILCNSCMHVGLGVLMFSVAVVGGKTELSAPFVDSIDSFGSKVHSIEVVCYGYVSPACFQHLACCSIEVKSKQFLDQLTVCKDMD